MKIAHLDLETTGLCPQKDVTVEVAIIVTDEKYQILDKLHCVINPNVKIPSGASNVHKITNDKAKTGRQLNEAMEDILKILSDVDYCCAFNGLRYDRALFSYEFDRYGIPIPKAWSEVWFDPFLAFSNPELDHLYPDSKRRLTDVAKMLGVPQWNEHNALEDVEGMILCMKTAEREGLMSPLGPEYFKFMFATEDYQPIVLESAENFSSEG